MSNFKKWKDKTAQVISLQLDPKNPRIPELGKSPSQREIAAELIRHDDAYDLARSIAEQGYFPTETLIATKERGELVILEGNRRLTALKCLLSPAFAPEDYEKRFHLLQSKADLESIRKVRISIAPSRELAVPIIIARHTTSGIQRWETAQQAKFVATLVSPDMTIDDVAKHYGISRSDVVNAVKLHTLYQIACTLDLPDDILTQVRNPRRFSMSTLERLANSSKVPEFLGTTFDDSGLLQGRIAVDEFKKGYSRIISDIATGKTSSRDLNTSRQIEEYLAGFGRDKPNLKTKGSFNTLSLLPKGQVLPKAQPRTKPKRKVKPSSSIIPRGFNCSVSSPRINDVFRELKGMRVEGYENCTGVMLRILIELATSNYLEITKKIKPLLDAANKKNKPKDWSPTLRQMLSLLLRDPDLQQEISRSAIKVLARATTNDNHPLSLDSLDQFVHNRLEVPTAKELRNFWAQFEELLAFLLVEPMPSC